MYLHNLTDRLLASIQNHIQSPYGKITFEFIRLIIKLAWLVFIVAGLFILFARA